MRGLFGGQCFISHAHTGRSANRGSCSQECRLPYTVTDGLGRVIAHEKHVLSIKDNDQSANLGALIDAGVRSFKIEGRYKDLGYVKNVTAHYRRLLDSLLEGRPGLRAASSGRTTFTFTPDPQRNFNRGATDYFVNGRTDDLGAFDSPKHAGLAVGHVVRVAPSQHRHRAGRRHAGAGQRRRPHALRSAPQPGRLAGQHRAAHRRPRCGARGPTSRSSR